VTWFEHRRSIAWAVACGAVALGGLVCSAGASAAPGRYPIAGSHPSWAVSQPGTAAPAVTSGEVNVEVYLASQDPSGLASFAQAVSDPSSATYGDYLSAAQVLATYGPTSAEAQAVQSWLQSAGMTVTQTTTGIGAYVAASGTLAEATDAFGVGFANYTDPSGQTARAPEAAATVPSSVASDVSSVAGLDTAHSFIRPQDQLPPPGPNYFVAGPTSDYYGQKLADDEPAVNGVYQPWNVGGYTPQQIRGAYGVTQSGMTGRGVTVAVLDAYASPTMKQDADEFSRVTRNQPFRPGQYQQYLASSFDDTAADECDAQGWYGEETLDVESVHDMAPDATVRYVGAQDCNDPAFVSSLAFIVNTRLATIVTDSWGEPYDTATLVNEYDQIFQAGAAEGIGFLFSSGDSGYEDPNVEDPGYSDQLQVDYPTSSPWVTSVGGTSLAIGRDDSYEWELPWGTLLDPLAASGTSWTFPPPPAFNPDSYDGSGGGGVSTAYTQPWYQRGVVPDSLATAVPEGSTTTPMRVVPDVSALADPGTGMLVGETGLSPSGNSYHFYLSRLGGTSVASPTFAGIEADAQQAAGHDLGFTNPVIYQRYGTPAFHDITEQTPIGPNTDEYEVRNNYTDPYTETGPLVTYLRAMGDDGGSYDGLNSYLPATPGYDGSTGVGSPNQYIQSFFGWHR